MDFYTIVVALIGFIVGMSVAVIIFRNFLVIGAFQIDNSADPYIFRLQLNSDIKDISEHSFVVCKIDTDWRVDRNQYIHTITEKELDK